MDNTQIERGYFKAETPAGITIVFSDEWKVPDWVSEYSKIVTFTPKGTPVITVGDAADTCAELGFDDD